MTVKELKAMLNDFPEDYQIEVYIDHPTEPREYGICDKSFDDQKKVLTLLCEAID